MNESVVIVSSTNSESFGSGFCISSELDRCKIVTCKHVIQNEGIRVNGHPGTEIEDFFDKDLDLALVEVIGLSLEPLQTSTLSKDSVASVVGYSKLLDKVVQEPIHNISVKTDVVVTDILKAKNAPALQLATKEIISKGYSGSPVICNTTKTVVGIVNIQKNASSNYALCCSNIPRELKTACQSEINKNLVISSLSRTLSDSETFWISKQFEQALEVALTPFSNEPVPWIEPNIQTEADETKRFTEEKPFDVNCLIDENHKVIITARQQFGSTSLCHYIKKEAWERHRAVWVYLDATQIKPHKKEVEKVVRNYLKNLALSENDIHGIMLDEASPEVESTQTVVDIINELYESKPILITYRRSDEMFSSSKFNYPNDFIDLYLWPLRRQDIRRLVTLYNQTNYIIEDDRLLSKIITDIDALSIPRTAQNCLTLLKISEIKFDDSPVNRSEMIGRVLFLLFNLEELPKYKAIPDVKDAEFILGYFSQYLIQNSIQFFSESEFVRILTNFCETNELELNIAVIFDILAKNNIIIVRQNKFCFKFKYWTLYFAAHRMLHSPEFREYVFSKRNYVSYPEIIEFYTGIDRRRNDAVELITSDLQSIINEVDSKTHIQEKSSIYEYLSWEPTQKQLDLVEETVNDTLEGSSLPTELKDSFADRNYDHLPTLNQHIHKIMDEYSLLKLYKGLSAASQALRNSDYAAKEARHALIKTILLGQEALTNALVALSPILASEGKVTADGATFVLVGEFSGDFLTKLQRVISILPSNVSTWFSDDIYSERMGPLIKNSAPKADTKIQQHYLHLLIAMKKPTGWKDILSNYIFENSKNSFFLKDLNNCLVSEYKYSYSSPKQLKEIEELVKMITAKHKKGIKRPGKNAINSMNGKVKLERKV